MNVAPVRRKNLCALCASVANPPNPAGVAMHDKMVTRVERMLDLHRQLPSLTDEGHRVVDMQIESTDREIDALVYALYGLSEDEVRAVEGVRPLPTRKQ